MALNDIIKFRLKKVNPFQGLVIDADTWKDAHEYHRDQMKLHVLAFHQIGIVEGLDVKASNPPDNTVTIQPGMAIDPEGNVIIVPQPQRYRIQAREKGTTYVTLHFREVPAEPYQPPDGGQPTRILDAYRLQEGEKLPAEPHLELARVQFDPSEGVIKDARNPLNPVKNEINMLFRQQAKAVVPERIITTSAPITPTAPAASAATVPARETVVIGHSVLGKAPGDLHYRGLQNLVKEINLQNSFAASLEVNVQLERDLSRFTMIYLAGNGSFELASDAQASIGTLLKSGGVIFGEGCTDGQGDAAAKAVREFGLAFNRLAGQFNRKLEMVQRSHLLLSAAHVFSEVPPGAEPGMLLENNGMLYSGSDYGCAWQGGHQSKPLSREVIRTAFEMGMNIVTHAHTTKR